jgi:hypothetical protein
MGSAIPWSTGFGDLSGFLSRVIAKCSERSAVSAGSWLRRICGTRRLGGANVPNQGVRRLRIGPSVETVVNGHAENVGESRNAGIGCSDWDRATGDGAQDGWVQIRLPGNLVLANTAGAFSENGAT